MTSDGRVILITGATDGLGRALADRVAADGQTVIIHGRDQQRLNRVAGELREQHGVAVHPVRADLSDLAQVRDAADHVAAITDRLHVFVSNAGIGIGEPDGRTRRTSRDGFELRFAINYLAGFLLTLELLPLLYAAAPARVVYVASAGQQPLDFDDLMLERDYTGMRAYGQSKLAQIMSGFALADRVAPSCVTFNSLHPSSLMPTKMVLAEVGYHVDTLEAGVAATYRAACSEELVGVSGAYFDRQEPARAHEQAYDPAVRAQLWARTIELIDGAIGAQPSLDRDPLVPVAFVTPPGREPSSTDAQSGV